MPKKTKKPASSLLYLEWLVREDGVRPGTLPASFETPVAYPVKYSQY